MKKLILLPTLFLISNNVMSIPTSGLSLLCPDKPMFPQESFDAVVFAQMISAISIFGYMVVKCACTRAKNA